MAVSADIPITFRVTPQMRDELERLATKAGHKSAATYARDLVTRTMGLTLPAPPSSAHEERLAAIASHLDRLVQEAAKRGERKAAQEAQEILNMATGISMPSPVRSTRSTDHLTPDRLAAIRQLSVVGGNLNQLCRWLNTGGRLPEATRVETLLDNLTSAIDRIARGA
ncbi:MAG: hypothetical protein CTY25_12060 [Methylobacterium sp.]|nr:MAG: hypothetical protein CTY25_12060 [Methylobacterium sp.]